MLELKNINLKYTNKTLFNNFGFKVEKGEKILIKGESGKGKSTMLKIILGFACADSGEVYIDKEKLDKKTVWNIRKKLAYVSQGLEFKPGKTKEVFEEIFSYENNKDIDYKKKTDYFFNYFDLDEDILSKSTEELSGGEKQRIGIIIAILLDRELYLLDEISSALDEKLKKKVADYFLKSDKTVLIVSHDREWQREGLRLLEI